MGIVSKLLWGAARVGLGFFDVFLHDQPALTDEPCSSPSTADMPSSAGGLLLPVWAVVLSICVTAVMGALATAGAFYLGRRSKQHSVVCMVCCSTYVRQLTFFLLKTGFL